MKKNVFCLILSVLMILGCINMSVIAFATGDDSWKLPEDPPDTVYGTGYIPSGTEYPPQPMRFIPASTATQYPAGVTHTNIAQTLSVIAAVQSPVRNQGNTGLCWSFASMGAIEAATIKAGIGTHPLSPVHAGHALSTAGGNSIYGFYTRPNPSDGGNPLQIMHYAKRDALNGFVRFTDDTTNLSGGISGRPLAQTQAISRSFVVPGAYYINTGKATTAEIKTAVANYGAVTTTMFGDNINHAGAFWNPTTNAYYQPSTSGNPSDHLVLIVGWDNDYPRTNFNSANLPTANGAWLVKNSWGTGWGLNGYFWISFEDKNAGFDSWVFAPAQPITVDDFTNKVYDYNRYSSALATYGTTAMYGTNVFSAGTSDETLTQVRVFVNSAPQSNIRVFLTRNYTSATQVGSTISANSPIATFSANYVGFYTVDIPSQPLITANSNFAVTVSNQSGISVSPIKPGIAAGRSFIGPSGATQDITSDGNATLIKAVTSPTSAITAPTIVAQPRSQLAGPGQNVSFTVFAYGTPEPSFQWQRSTNNGVTWNNVSGGTSATLTLTGVTLSDNGSRYRCVITNTEGSITSTEVTLTVSEGGYGPNPPTGIADISGETMAMTVFIVVSAALWGIVIVRRRKGSR